MILWQLKKYSIDKQLNIIRIKLHQKSKTMKKLCIGLFGTCGNSKWRDPFMEKYKELGIKFFNPQVEDWKPEDAAIEAEHLANDAIILFPVTSETYEIGSLSETGFSILQSIRLDDRRDFVIMIDPKPDQSLEKENAVAFKESCRARALVIQHLKNLGFLMSMWLKTWNRCSKLANPSGRLTKLRKVSRNFH